MQQNRPIGWTTIEESRKLVEAGLDPYSADMHYDVNDVIELIPLKIDIFPYVNKHRNAEYYHPCWSLGRLLALFPSDNNGEHVEIARVMKSKYYHEHWSLYFIDPKDHKLYGITEVVLIDGVVKMVLLCLEHGIIRKGGII